MSSGDYGDKSNLKNSALNRRCAPLPGLRYYSGTLWHLSYRDSLN